MKWEAVFFDFDGVILDTVHLKAAAFGELFRHFGPDIEQKVVEYHLAHGGISRFEKFRYWYREYLNSIITDHEIEILSNRFSQIVVDKILKAPYIDGVVNTLHYLKERSIPAYVISGTPEDEIRYIVEKKDLSRFFLEVYGSPQQKVVILREICFLKKYQPNNCLFVGDSVIDYEAAFQNGVQFIGIVKDNSSPFPSEVKISKTVTILEGQ